MTAAELNDLAFELAEKQNKLDLKFSDTYLNLWHLWNHGDLGELDETN